MKEQLGWQTVLSSGVRQWARSSFGYFVQMAPIMIVAGFASGLVIQWLSPESVTEYLGNDVRGVLIAATFGVLINVPLLFEIPLVALLLLLGMGTAPAGVLLFTAAAGGPVTFWGLAKVMPKRALATFATATWALGVAGGLTVLIGGTYFWGGGGVDGRVAAAHTCSQIDALHRGVLYETLEVDQIRQDLDVIDRDLDTNVEPMRSNARSFVRWAREIVYGGFYDYPTFEVMGYLETYEQMELHVQVDASLHRLRGLCDWEPLTAPSPEYVSLSNTATTSAAEPPTAIPTVAPVDTNIRFYDVAESAGVAFKHQRDSSFIPLGGGASVGDFNGDGLPDLYVTNSSGPNALFLNNGDGTFTDVAYEAGVDNPEGHGNGAAAGDYDNDGDLDLFVANFHDGLTGTSKLFRNDGTGTFTDVTTVAGVGEPDGTYRSTGATWGDYDLDGFLDLLVVRHLGEHRREVFRSQDLSEVARPLGLYRNNGDGTFSNETSPLADFDVPAASVMGAGFKPSFVDYDNDGDPDIYIVNDFGGRLRPNILWRNDGDGRFTDVSIASGADIALAGMGLGLGDYDNDGDFDFYVSNMGASVFLEQEEGNRFTDVTGRTGTGRGVIPGNEPGPDASGLPVAKIVQDASVGWGTVFADFNNNGLLDLYLVAGYLDSDPQVNLPNQPNALFQNLGDGTFADVSSQTGADDPGIGREVVAADFNADGLLDLFIVNIGDLNGKPGIARLMQNRSTDTGNWLAVKLVGSASNRDCLGARVSVTADGVTRIREMGASQGHQSQSVVPVHFGLGDATEVSSVVITYPGGGVQTLENVPVNQMLTVIER